MGRYKERRAKRLYDLMLKYDKDLMENFFNEMDEFLKHLSNIFKDV